MKKALSLILALAMSVSLVACGAKEEPAPAPAPAPEASQPAETPAEPAGNYVYNGGRLTIGGADSTGTMYAAAAAIATTFGAKVEGLNVDATTSSGSNENALNVQEGEIELGMCSGDAAAAAVAGTGKFEAAGACTDIVAIGAVYASLSNWIALKSSGYEYLHDAVGGVFGIGPAASTSESSALLGLEAAGITADNSTFQNVTLGDGADNVANGVMTAATAFAGIPVGAQLNASVTKDCVWLGFTDAELDAILEANPSYYKTVIPAGTYNGQDADVPTFGVKCMVICNKSLDSELVYNLAKTLAENTEEMIAGNGVFASMADPNFICNDLPIALHDGAAAYYKDAGMLK
jgi:TRAP transporter TAXI family solute receptor